MTYVKIKRGAARRLGLRRPPDAMPGLITFPRDISPEAVEEFMRQFEERLGKARYPVRLYPSVEPEVTRCRWFRRDSA